MARLPSEKFLMQQIGDMVVLFEDFTEREIARFDPADSNAVLSAQKDIRDSELSEEDKCFAHFWSGYFYFYFPSDRALVPDSFIPEHGQEAVITDSSGNEVVRFRPEDGNACAMAQEAVFDSSMSPEEKSLAHLRSGFAYAHASN